MLKTCVHFDIWNFFLYKGCDLEDFDLAQNLKNGSNPNSKKNFLIHLSKCTHDSSMKNEGKMSDTKNKVTVAPLAYFFRNRSL